MRKLKYAFKGLDLRTNELYRTEGTASDCRNVRLDSNRRLVKRRDFDETQINRGTSGETGSFEDKLPYSSIIVAIMPFEDHKVIATVQPTSAGTQSVNKYYKWTEETNTLEPIALAIFNEVNDSTIGNHSARQENNVYNRFKFINQEKVLFFRGVMINDDTIADDGSITDTDRSEQRTPLFKYDGKQITRAGVDVVINDEEDVSDQGVLSSTDYVKIVPFTFDDKNRFTFGKISTHITDTDSFNNLQLNITAAQIDSNVKHRQAYFRLTSDHTLAETDSVATRTITVEIQQDADGASVAKGQWLFGIRETNTSSGGIPPTRFNRAYEIYKFKVADVDYVLSTVTVSDFYIYDTDIGEFTKTATLSLQAAELTQQGFCGTHINALYASSTFTAGYDFIGYTILGELAGATTYNIIYASTKSTSGSSYTSINFDPELLFITNSLEDMYDESTIKFPVPKIKDFTDYLGAIVCCDSTTVYFSDFSVGGNIETFVATDAFPVGSSNFGEITGVFANETFLAVFRERESYYLTGNLFTLNYRVQSYKSTLIGCSSPTSIVPFKGSGIFVSERGIYVCSQGGRMDEISDVIEPLFTEDALNLDLDAFDVKTIIDFKNELIIMDFASKASDDHFQLVYCYYHQEWFLYEDIPSNRAFSQIDDKLYVSDGNNVFIQSDVSEDSDAYYRSNFESLNNPSVDKKFTRLWVSTISIRDSFSLGVKTYRNWNVGQVRTNEVKSGSDTDVNIIQNLNTGSRHQSMAFELVSDSGNKMILDGYEYTVEGPSKEFKSDDN